MVSHNRNGVFSLASLGLRKLHVKTSSSSSEAHLMSEGKEILFMQSWPVVCLVGKAGLERPCIMGDVSHEFGFVRDRMTCYGV